MQLIRQARELQNQGRKVSVAIGMFDGVHLGHQQVIRQAIQDARRCQGLSLAITFDQHPATVVAPQRVPPLIYSLPQKLREIEALGVDAILLIHFDREFSEKSGETFVRDLAADLGRIFSVCVGDTFTFGCRRTGNVALLQKLGRELQFQVHGLAAVSLNHQVVSSTRIRECIASGDLDDASQMLGRAYSILGKVVQGDRLGHKLGVPTANLDISGLLTPPHGVYAVHGKTGGQSHRGVANVGTRPTVSSSAQRRLEVHLFDFSQDLYHQDLEVSFVQFIRGEMRFPDLAALQNQMRKDLATARDLL